MATMQDYEIIEVIKATKKEAELDRENIPYALSGGKEYYRKAINSIINAGNWTIAIAIVATTVSIALNMIELFNVSQEYKIDNAYMVGYFIGICLVAILPIVFGYKLRKLESTPTATLVFLILNIIANLFLFAGILPIVSVILTIIALVHWSTYRDWFYNIDTKRSK